MLILIAYDVNTTDTKGRKRLNKVAKVCASYGQRVQNSLFECDLDSTQLVLVKSKLLCLIDKTQDSLRIYNLGKKYSGKVEHYEIKEAYDPEGELIL